MEMRESSYRGPERRRHQVLVTRNSEYHMRDDECVAVREVGSGSWKEGHSAVGRKLVGTWGPERIAFGEVAPYKGARLCFSGDLVTSAVLRIRRPSRQTAMFYMPELKAS